MKATLSPLAFNELLDGALITTSRFPHLLSMKRAVFLSRSVFLVSLSFNDAD
jgi:hypothetical protein